MVAGDLRDEAIASALCGATVAVRASQSSSLGARRLRPPRSGRRIDEDTAPEHGQRLREPFVNRHQHVLVLDRDGPLVPGQPQFADELLPEEFAVSETDRPKGPRPVGDLPVWT